MPQTPIFPEPSISERPSSGSLASDGTYSSNGIEIKNLAKEWRHATYYSSVLLDIGGDAQVTASKPLEKLNVACYDINHKVHTLGIDTSGRIKLSSKMDNGSIVYVDDVEVGTIDRSGIIDEDPRFGFTVTFRPSVSAAQVEVLLHSLNYTNGGPTVGGIEHEIEHLWLDIDLVGADNTYCSTGSYLTVAGPGISPLSLADDAINGSDGEDLIGATASSFGPNDHIDGKEGIDTLFLTADYGTNFELHRLGSLKGVEFIQGTAGHDLIWISQRQLSDVQVINGGGWGNDIRIVGAEADFRSKVLNGFASIELMENGATVTFDNKSQALLAKSNFANTHVILKGHAFTEEEKALLREQGIDMITDDADLYPLPQIANLDGNTVTTQFGETARIDAGSNASLINGKDDPQSLIFYIAASADEDDRLGIATDNTGISLSDGMEIGSVISMETSTGTKVIGYIVDPGEGSNPWYIQINFALNATNADAQALIRALTYTRDSVGSSALHKNIGIFLEDREGQTATATININVEAQMAPQITNLDGDNISTTRGTTVLLDVDSNAVVTDDDPFYMAVRRNNAQAGDHFGILTDVTGISVPDGVNVNSVVYIGTGPNAVAIGEITGVDAWTLEFHFYEETTAAQVQALIRALTYTNAAAAGDAAYEHEITIYLEDEQGDTSFSTVTVSVDPSANPSKNLTTGIDHITGDGTAEVFQADADSINVGDELDGGGDIDTLQLTGGKFDLTKLALTDVEIIQGSTGNDTLIVGSDVLADVQQIRGGGTQNQDTLWIKGAVDLSGIDIDGFSSIGFYNDASTMTIDDADLLPLITGYGGLNDTLVVKDNIELTDDQRLALHRRGVDRIINKDVTTIHNAPTGEELNGDRVTAAAGQAVFLDKDRNTIITAKDGLLGYLGVFIKGTTDTQEHLGFASDDVELSGGLAAGTKVRVKTDEGFVEIGTVKANSNDRSFGIDFNANATPALVQKLIRALTYTHDTGSFAEARDIGITLKDAGQRPSIFTVTVDPAVNDHLPVNLRLAGSEGAVPVREGSTAIGALTADDGDGNPITWSFDTTAAGGGDANGMFVIQNGHVKLSPGRSLDFESGERAYTIAVKAFDGEHSVTKTFTIGVTDVWGERVTGTAGADILRANLGDDVLDGGLGADYLSGGVGNDIYYVDHARDRVVESSRGGTADRVHTAVSHTLAAYVEKLSASGSASIRLTGNTLANTITGNGGKNTIAGGKGQDTLYGGKGQDAFVFDTRPGASNLDKIGDWKAADDTLKLDRDVFKALKSTGRLSKAKFVLGSKALKTTQHVGYDEDKGLVWYDANGSDRGGYAAIVNIGKHKDIAANDIFVI